MQHKQNTFLLIIYTGGITMFKAKIKEKILNNIVEKSTGKKTRINCLRVKGKDLIIEYEIV